MLDPVDFVVPPVVVQAPPTLADPQVEELVRSKPSDAMVVSAALAVWVDTKVVAATTAEAKTATIGDHRRENAVAVEGMRGALLRSVRIRSLWNRCE
jgi:hypothetical protein